MNCNNDASCEPYACNPPLGRMSLVGQKRRTIGIHRALLDASQLWGSGIDDMRKHGEEIPVPTPPVEIDREDALSIVAIDIPDTMKVERVNVTIPARHIRREISRDAMIISRALPLPAAEACCRRSSQAVI